MTVGRSSPKKRLSKGCFTSDALRRRAVCCVVCAALYRSTPNRNETSGQCFIQGPFGGETSPQSLKLPPPQEFSATPVVKLKIMSILDVPCFNFIK